VRVKEAKRADVERFLRQHGYTPGRDTGSHTWWTKPDSRPIPPRRPTRISPGVLRDIGFVPQQWK
jgi:predicted RNA binding protein YcfA (HicA-like mRNA interferase family)